MTPDEIARRLGWNLARVPRSGGDQQSRRQPLYRRCGGARRPSWRHSRRGICSFRLPHWAGSKVGAAAQRRGRDDTAGRDIFLDDDQKVGRQSAPNWKCWRAKPKRSGIAIAIGHPHDVTLKLLAAWLAQDHGVMLVPLDEAIRLKAERATAVAVR